MLTGLTAFIIAIVTACSPTTEVESFQSLKEDLGQDSRIVLYHQEDRIIKQEITYTELYSVYEVGNRQEAKKELTDTFNFYKDVKGLNFKVYYGKDRLKRTISIDYNKADVKEVAGLLHLSGSDAEIIGYISFKEQEELLKRQGFHTVKNKNFKELP